MTAEELSLLVVAEVGRQVEVYQLHGFFSSVYSFYHLLSCLIYMTIVILTEYAYNNLQLQVLCLYEYTLWTDSFTTLL